MADLNGDGAEAVAKRITDTGKTPATAHQVDVGVEAELINLIDETESRFGPIDLFCSNAGIGLGKGIDASDEEWGRHLASQHPIAYLGGSPPSAQDDRPRRRLPVEHRLRSRPAHPNRLGHLRGHQACGGRLGRVDFNHPRPGWHQGVRALPASGAHGQ